MLGDAGGVADVLQSLVSSGSEEQFLTALQVGNRVVSVHRALELVEYRLRLMRQTLTTRLS